MKNQTQEWSYESCRYVSSYLNDSEIPSSDLQRFTDYLTNLPPSPKILDVGCGNGAFLKCIVKLLGAQKGVGIEPSQKAVDLLENKYAGDDNLEFHRISAHSLPYKSDEFDLVVIWSVLHWIGRNEYLQALGELVRVSKRYIVVMDFVGSREYKVPYSHKKGFYTYKMDFEIPLIASGILNKVAEERWVMDQNEQKIPISEEDLIPFEEKSENWGARKMVVFEKNYDALTTLESDFF